MICKESKRECVFASDGDICEKYGKKSFVKGFKRCAWEVKGEKVVIEMKRKKK